MHLAWIDPAADAPALTVEHLRASGVLYQRYALEDQAYQEPLDALAEAQGYIEQDVIELRPDTPNLEAICAKFVDEHLHTDDEVRFVLEGEGIFDLRSDGDRWIRAEVEKGDLLVVPAGLYHRFFLTARKHIRCVRLFQDSSGWVPHYR